MSDKAIETDDEVAIESTEEVVEEVSDGDLEGVTFSDPEDAPEEVEATEAETEVVEAAPEEEELEIVVEGEDEPASEPVRKSGFYKRLSKVTGQRDAASSEAEEERLRREAVEEENKLLRLRLNQDSPTKRPKAEDFDTDAEFDNALEKYDETRIQAAAAKVVAEQLESVQGQNTQTQQVNRFNAKHDETYAQAEKLKIKDFGEAEDKVVDMVGQNMVEYIVAYHGEKSAAMIFKLSKDPVKAQEFNALNQSTDPEDAVRLAQRLTRYEDSVTIRTKRSPAPSPEKTIDKGAPASDALSGATFE